MKQLENELAQARASLETAERTHNEQLGILNKELESLRMQSRADSKTLQQELDQVQQEFGSLQQQARIQCDSMRQKHANKLQKVQAESEASKRKYREAVEHEHKEQLRAQQQQHKDRLQGLEQQHKDRLRTQEQQYKEQLWAQEQQHKDRLQGLEQQHKEQLQALQQECNKQLQTRQWQHDESRRMVTQAVASVKSWALTVISIVCECLAEHQHAVQVQAYSVSDEDFAVQRLQHELSHTQQQLMRTKYAAAQYRAHYLAQVDLLCGYDVNSM